SAERRTLSLDRKNRFIGGVCAGFARYLDLPIWVVRLLTLFAVFTFALTIAVYIVLYFVLDAQAEDTGQPSRSSGLVGRLRRFEWRRPLYKNKKRGKIQGVCTGVADYLQINPLIVRVLLLGSLFFGPLGILLYICAAVVMEDGSTQAPVNQPNGEDSLERNPGRYKSKHHDYPSNHSGKNEAFQTHQQSDRATELVSADFDEIALHFDALEQRLRRLEATITSRKYQLQRELKKMSASS